MIKLFFINLAIDQLWDQDHQLNTLFSARIPRSEKIIRSNENLAKYLCQPGDQILVLKANPFDCNDWLGEASQKLDPDQHYELWPASVSRLELGLLAQFPKMSLASWLPKDFPAADLNRKSFIQKWSDISGLPVPQSEILTVSELMELKFLSKANFPFYLKAEWGAGGGANFLIQSPEDTALRILKRQLQDQKHGTWIKQKKIETSKNFSVFGWAHLEKPTVMEVQYDVKGQSYEHRLATPEQSSILYQPFTQIARELYQKYKYSGPFGFDVIVDQQQRLFLVDVNIRFTKTHLIEAAAKYLNIDLKKFTSKRVRNISGKSLESSGKDFKIYLESPHEVSYFEEL